MEKTKQNYKTRYKLGIIFICLIIFMYILINVLRNEKITLDIIGYDVISKLFISNYMTVIAKIITSFSEAICLLAITIAILVNIKDKKIGGAVAINLLLVVGLNVILKNIVQRPRPTEYRLANAYGYSFPSGHSMVSMAFYGFLIYLIHKYIKKKWLKRLLIPLLSVLIILVGVSRIYLGVHYTSDVIAGFLISLSYLIIYVELFDKQLYIFKKVEK